ncbi:MAG: hypothetical protein GXZ02_08600 [Clostridiales bacterium]|nr:hypothetical protein [Clostridiales bacterium]
MQNKRAFRDTSSGAFSGIFISVVKIFIVLVIIITFVIYIATPPGTQSFFTNSAQSNTIVRDVDPI